MLHNFMITSGRGAIVLYRKQFTKALKNPRLIAGLVTALCDFSIGSGVGLPVNIIELDEFTVTVVEMADDDVEDDRDCFRAVLFHDNSDGDFYGHVLGTELLKVFKTVFAERLSSMQLANVEGAEDIFKPFGAHIRSAVKSSIRPMMQILESHIGIKEVFVLGHRPDDMFGKTVERVLYSSAAAKGASLIADVQALLSAGDDLLSSQQDQTSVVTVGVYVRIQRLDAATLIVVTEPPHTSTSCQGIISACTNVLQQLLTVDRVLKTLVFVLLRHLEGSRGILS